MSQIRNAAAILLTRGKGADLEVYLVERNPALRFFGGYWACPGGVVEAADGHPTDEPEPPPEEAFLACAGRELAEETAVSVAGEEFEVVVMLTTPKFVPVRYRTMFLHARLPAGALPRVEPGELVRGEFVRPAAALDDWRRGERLIVPPVLFLLELLATRSWPEFRADVSRHAAALDAGRLHSISFSPGIFVAPLETPTLPPATTTNCLLVGEERILVVDPASADPAEQARLFDLMDEWIAAGRGFDAIVVTHHHQDHVGGVDAVSRRYDLPVLGHALTLERLPAAPARRRILKDGDRLDLGTAPDGSPGWFLDVFETPGHDRGHLAFRDSRYGAIVAGDLVSTLSTIIIDPPEGHLATYLRSLERMRALPSGMIHPAHGPAFRDSRALLRHYLDHRQQREDALTAALRRGPAPPRDLVPFVYADIEPRLHGLAERSLQAGLDKLVEEGRAVQRGARYEWVEQA